MTLRPAVTPGGENILSTRRTTLRRRDRDRMTGAHSPGEGVGGRVRSAIDRDLTPCRTGSDNKGEGGWGDGHGKTIGPCRDHAGIRSASGLRLYAVGTGRGPGLGGTG